MVPVKWSENRVARRLPGPDGSLGALLVPGWVTATLPGAPELTLKAAYAPSSGRDNHRGQHDLA